MIQHRSLVSLGGLPPWTQCLASLFISLTFRVFCSATSLVHGSTSSLLTDKAPTTAPFSERCTCSRSFQFVRGGLCLHLLGNLSVYTTGPWVSFQCLDAYCLTPHLTPHLTSNAVLEKLKSFLFETQPYLAFSQNLIIWWNQKSSKAVLCHADLCNGVTQWFENS